MIRSRSSGWIRREEALVRRVERLRLVAVDPVELVGPPVGVGGDVPVVVAHLGELLRVVDPVDQVVVAQLGSQPTQRLAQEGEGDFVLSRWYGCW